MLPLLRSAPGTFIISKLGGAGDWFGDYFCTDLVNLKRAKDQSHHQNWTKIARPIAKISKSCNFHHLDSDRHSERERNDVPRVTGRRTDNKGEWKNGNRWGRHSLSIYLSPSEEFLPNLRPNSVQIRHHFRSQSPLCLSIWGHFIQQWQSPSPSFAHAPVATIA